MVKYGQTEALDIGSSVDHYENKPIQIYRKFHLQKMKFFR